VTDATSSAFDFDRYEVLTFDCYGTLIDWESGILAALRPVLDAHAVSLDDEAALALFGELESAVEAGPYRPYRDVLRQVLIGIGDRMLFSPLAAEADAFAASVMDWPAFADSTSALAALAERFALGVITNCDDDLFAASAAKLGNPFRWVVTAQQVRSYKPDPAHFKEAERRIGTKKGWVHVASSYYYDVEPCIKAKIPVIWVNRNKETLDASQKKPTAEVKTLLEAAKLLGETRRWFKTDFDLVVTAQQVRSYKPDPAHFKEAERRIGTKKGWVHVASSYYYDVEPCIKAKIPVIWVNRNKETLDASQKKPTAEVKTLLEAAKLLGAA
jgi:2-haloalkanoic acid dehalogenase type II